MECDLRLSDGANVALYDFNSRTHVECDSNAERKMKMTLNFNSRTHVECDYEIRNSFRRLIHFNSRTHVECDAQLKHVI